MQYDPDLIRQNQAPQQVFSQPQPPQFAYSGGNAGKAGFETLLMAFFCALNLIFLFISAAYSVGLFQNEYATKDGASFFVTVIMTFISAALGLLCASLGLRFAKVANNKLFVSVHKAFFVVILVFSALVLIGPIFN